MAQFNVTLADVSVTVRASRLRELGELGQDMATHVSAVKKQETPSSSAGHPTPVLDTQGMWNFYPDR